MQADSRRSLPRYPPPSRSNTPLHGFRLSCPGRKCGCFRHQQSHLTALATRQIHGRCTGKGIRQVLGKSELLRILIEANRTTEVLHLVRSLLYNLAEDYALLHPSAQLSRAEQICGQFLSLVEMHCREQHRVDWYASQMCLAPKYLSNVLKQTLNIPPNTCIDRALIRQAKSLLSSTPLSVQQISDRLGFQNQSHFGTFFRRQVGISPAAFRKRT